MKPRNCCLQPQAAELVPERSPVSRGGVLWRRPGLSSSHGTVLPQHSTWGGEQKEEEHSFQAAGSLALGAPGSVLRRDLQLQDVLVPGRPPSSSCGTRRVQTGVPGGSTSPA